MPPVRSTPEAAIARSIRLKRLNSLTAILFGGLPAVILGLAFPGGPERYLAGFVLGVLWANAFEYFYHRSLLHSTVGTLAQHHLEHHAATGNADEADHVNFGESPVWVALLFVINEVVVVAADLLLGFRIAPGMLVAFSVYFVLLEEIHWRVHLDGWLPPGLRSAKIYHLRHHGRPNARFNVFLPLFDWVCSTTSPPLGSRQRAVL